MKFLFIAPRFHTNFQYQVRALINSGHYVDFLSLCSFSNEDFSIIKPKILGYSKLFYFLNIFANKISGKLPENHSWKNGFPPILRLWREMSGAKADVILIKNIESIYSLIAAIFAKVLGAQVLFMLQIDKYRPKPKSWSVALVGFLFNAKVITPLLGDPQYRNLNDNLFFVPFPHPVQITDREFFTGDKINIICVGKFSKRKEQLLLLNAIAELKSKFELSVTLIGQRSEDDYLTLVLDFIKKNKLDLIVNIKFDLPWRDLYGEYKKHDLFVLPSYDEPISFSAIEAMSCGLPVICSDRNGVKWYVKEGENGFVFKSGDLSDLVNKIKLIVQDRHKVIQMGKKALEFIEEICSLEVYSNNIMRIISKQ